MTNQQTLPPGYTQVQRSGLPEQWGETPGQRLRYLTDTAVPYWRQTGYYPPANWQQSVPEPPSLRVEPLRALPSEAYTGVLTGEPEGVERYGGGLDVLKGPQPVDWGQSFTTMGKGLIDMVFPPDVLFDPPTPLPPDASRREQIQRAFTRKTFSDYAKAFSESEGWAGAEEFINRFLDPLGDLASTGTVYTPERGSLASLLVNPSAKKNAALLMERGYDPVEAAQAAASQTFGVPGQRATSRGFYDPFNLGGLGFGRGVVRGGTNYLKRTFPHLFDQASDAAIKTGGAAKGAYADLPKAPQVPQQLALIDETQLPMDIPASTTETATRLVEDVADSAAVQAADPQLYDEVSQIATREAHRQANAKQLNFSGWLEQVEGDRAFFGKQASIRVSVQDDPRIYGKTSMDLDLEDINIRQSSGKPPSGRGISIDDARVPKMLYHVSTNAPLIRANKIVRAGGIWKEVRGDRTRAALGGSVNDDMVPLVVSKEVAEQLAKDYQLAAEMNRFQALRDMPGAGAWGHYPQDITMRLPAKNLSPELMIKAMGKFMRESMEEGWNKTEQGQMLTQAFQDTVAGRVSPESTKNLLDQYFTLREGATGIPHPYQFGELETLRGWYPEHVGVIAIPKSALKTGGLLTEMDLGVEGALNELRFYGDIPIKRQAMFEAPKLESQRLANEPMTAEQTNLDLPDATDWEYGNPIDEYSSTFPTREELHNKELLDDFVERNDTSGFALANTIMSDEPLSQAIKSKVGDVNNLSTIGVNKSIAALTGLVNRSFPMLGSRYNKAHIKLNDMDFGRRALIDQVHIKPGQEATDNIMNLPQPVVYANKVGRFGDLLRHALTAEGEFNKGVARFFNLVEYKLNPLLGLYNEGVITQTLDKPEGFAAGVERAREIGRFIFSYGGKGRKAPINVEGGVSREDMALFVQLANWEDVARRHPARDLETKMPRPQRIKKDAKGEPVIDKTTGDPELEDYPFLLDEAGEHIHLRDYFETRREALGDTKKLAIREYASANWRPGDNAWDQQVVKGAKEIAEAYKNDRNLLNESGIISDEMVPFLNEEFPFYNPTVNIDYLPTNPKDFGGNFIGRMLESTDPIKGLSKDPEHFGALDPLDERVMLRHFMQTEYRRKKNAVNKFIYNMLNVNMQNTGDKPLGYLVEVTADFEKEVTESFKVIENGKEVTKKQTYIKRLPIPFNPEKKQAFIDIWGQYGPDEALMGKAGERRVFADITTARQLKNGKWTAKKNYKKEATEDNLNFIHKELYENLYGSGGLANRPKSDVMAIGAMVAGLRRMSMTAMNPIFSIANGTVDAFGVWVRLGVMPYSVFKRAVREMFAKDGIMRDANSNVLTMYKAMGADRSRLTNIGDYTRQLEKRSVEEGLDGTIIQSANLYDNTAWKNKILDALENNLLARGTQAIEHAPRLEVIERILRRSPSEGGLGTVEWEKLKRLAPTDFIDALMVDYKGQGPLIDHPAIGKAAMAALDSTLNFWRGGELIRKINPYTYFLNAATESSKVPWRTMGVTVWPKIEALPAEELVELRKLDPDASMWKIGDWDLKMGPTGEMYNDLDLTRRYPDLAAGMTPAQIPELRAQLNKAGIIEHNLLGYIDGVATTTRKAVAAPLKKLGIEKRTMRKMAAFRLAAVAVTQMSIMTWNLAHADEWGYWNIPGWLKYSGLLILLPPKRDPATGEYMRDADGRIIPNYILLPHRTREWTLQSGSGVYVMEKLYEDSKSQELRSAARWADNVDPNTGEALERTNWRKFGSQVFNNLSPVQQDVFSFWPFASEMIEEFTGKDRFRGQNIVSPNMANLDPELQYTPNTSPVAKMLSKYVDEDWPLVGTYASPIRMDNFLDNTQGLVIGTNQQFVYDILDYSLKAINHIKRRDELIEPGSPAEQVRRFRNIKDRHERDVFKSELTAILGPEAREKFDAELRKPRLETYPEREGVDKLRHMARDLPLIERIFDRYNPPYSGGIRDLYEDLQDQDLGKGNILERGMNWVFGTDTPAERARKQSLNFSAESTAIKKRDFKTQQWNDSRLTQFTHKPLTGRAALDDPSVDYMTPKAWREARHELNLAYQGWRDNAQLDKNYSESIYALTPEEQTAHYSKVFEVIGTSTTDVNARVDMLVHEFYALTYPDYEGMDLSPQVRAELESEFFEAREKFQEDILTYWGEDVATRFEERRTRYMTATEKAFEAAQKVMRPYWNMKKDIYSFMRNPSQIQTQVWQQYLKATPEQRNDMWRPNHPSSKILSNLHEHLREGRRQFVKRVSEQVPASEKATLDVLLVYWYGSSNPNDRLHKPATAQGEAEQARWYGANSLQPSWMPTQPTTNPLQLAPGRYFQGSPQVGPQPAPVAPTIMPQLQQRGSLY